MTPLEKLLSGEKWPSVVFGYGYTGPEKPSDTSTAIYLALFVIAIGVLLWVTFFY